MASQPEIAEQIARLWGEYEKCCAKHGPESPECERLLTKIEALNRKLD